MSGRVVPFDKEATCDGCGAIGAFDFMGDLICAKCLATFNDLDGTELLGRAVFLFVKSLRDHRKKAAICCPEDCWCWEAEKLIDDYERWLEQ